jgi:(p)ppGpp synthase/HD superfamily hydrolase
MEFTMELSGFDVVRKAQVYAMAAHAAVGQKRKYTFEPYIVHPAEVAKIVAGVPGATPDMVAAAWLHDVVEDTGCTFTDIHMGFGIDIATLVQWLTDVSKPEDGNRAARKAIDRAHSAQAPAEAQTIKLADLISNSRSIVQHDPEFAKVYLEEKRLLLEVMTKGDPTLMAEARKYIGG